jgi:hypothetical protein
MGDSRRAVVVPPVVRSQIIDVDDDTDAQRVQAGPLISAVLKLVDGRGQLTGGRRGNLARSGLRFGMMVI